MNDEQITRLKYLLGSLELYQKQLNMINKSDSVPCIYNETAGIKKVEIVGELSVQVMDLVKENTKTRLSAIFSEMTEVLNAASPYQ